VKVLEMAIYNNPLALDGINFRLLSATKEEQENGKLFITPGQ